MGSFFTDLERSSIPRTKSEEEIFLEIFYLKQKFMGTGFQKLLSFSEASPPILVRALGYRSKLPLSNTGAGRHL